MKKTFIIISVVVIVLLLIAIGYFYISGSNNTSGENPIVVGFKSFFPFGGNQYSPSTSTENEIVPTPNPNQNQNSQSNFTLKLRELSAEPVSGFGLFDKQAGTVVRYIEKATGHIFDIELFSPNQNRVSNTTLPLVYDALWGSQNNVLIARSLEDNNETVDTYSLNIKSSATSTENMVLGTKMVPNITDASVSGLNVFYLVDNGDSTSGFVSNFDGTKKKQIWSSVIRELNSQFVNDKTVVLTTRPAQNVTGYAYLIGTGSGSVSKILSGPGLSTLIDPLATQVLFTFNDSGISMFVNNIKTNTSVKVTPATIVDKCVWSKKDSNVIFCAVPREDLDGSSMISWYQGQVLFTDDIWKFDLKNNKSSLIENLSNDAGGAVDVVKPTLSVKEDYLVFVNKRDGSLWSINLLK